MYIVCVYVSSTQHFSVCNPEGGDGSWYTGSDATLPCLTNPYIRHSVRHDGCAMSLQAQTQSSHIDLLAAGEWGPLDCHLDQDFAQQCRSSGHRTQEPELQAPGGWRLRPRIEMTKATSATYHYHVPALLGSEVFYICVQRTILNPSRPSKHVYHLSRSPAPCGVCNMCVGTAVTVTAVPSAIVCSFSVPSSSFLPGTPSCTIFIHSCQLS